MRVPSADIGKSNLEADFSLGELRNLTERLPEWRARILGAVLRLVFCRIGHLQHLHRVEGVATGAAENPVGGRSVLGFERCRRRVATANAELTDLVHRQRR